MSDLLLYHGSTRIIEHPEFGKGNSHNDYGLGFYCTEDIELAKEWACGTKFGGYVNTYSLAASDINVLWLEGPGYGALDWLALLVNNRVFSINAPIMAEAKEYLIAHFLPDVAGVDAVRGYRADDSYFTFAADFLGNTISLRQLSRAMRFGMLGEQFVLKSRKAFEALLFLCGEPADAEVYYTRRRQRDVEARKQYIDRERKSPRQSDDIFMIDILREEMTRGDARLQRNLRK